MRSSSGQSTSRRRALSGICHGVSRRASASRATRSRAASASAWRPPVLVLDDPLSSVDVHTEAVIEESLGRVLAGVTGLLVVHRPSTLALADRVALIDGGTVAAIGTHSELMKSNDIYRGLLRRRSRRLLATLAGPYRGELLVAAALILIRSAAYLALPYLVGLGIDKGIRPGHTGNLTTLAVIVAALLLALAINAVANYLFLLLSGRIGSDVLFDLRRTLFAHVQELSLSFYERYTSGRIISRLTSDVDALNELLATGLTSVIVHYVESLGGIRAVHAFRREPRNQEIFEDVNGRYRDANIWSNRLASTFGPAINMLGRL